MIRAGGGVAREYEKVVVDEWINGEIEDIQVEPEHTFKFKGEEKIAPALRFKFKLDGYQYPKYSRWMQPFTTEKSALYSQYLKYLTPKYDCKNKEVDLLRLRGMKVKTMWVNNEEFQNLTQIRPLDGELNIILSASDIQADVQF